MSIVSMCQYLVVSYLSRDLELFSAKRIGLRFGGDKGEGRINRKKSENNVSMIKELS